MDLAKKASRKEAERELKEALDEQPDHPLLLASLAHLYLKQDRVAEAKIMTESISARDPGNRRALFLQGEIFFRENFLEKALECFRQAARQDSSPYLIHGVAKTLRAMERYEEALEIVDTALMSDRESLRLLKEKAMILNRMGRWKESQTVYEKVKEVDPDDRFARKEIYRLRGMDRPEEKVIHELKRVIQLSPDKDDPQIVGLLAQKLKEAGKMKEAADEFYNAWQLDPGNLFFLKQEGFCRYRLGEYHKAIDALARVFQENPDDYRIKSTLQKMYRATGNMDDFIELLEKILQTHPGKVKLIGILKGLKKQSNAKRSAHK